MALVPALACQLPSLPLIGDGPSATPTPMGDTLILTVPVYRISLDPGDTVPGAKLTYVGKNNNAYDVIIDDLPATRRTGDSFSWYGVVAPGVIANYNLRLTTTLLGRLVAAGSVTLNVFNPAPQPVAAAPTTFALSYSSIAVQYWVPAGSSIPGTALVYERTVEPGGAEGVAQSMAQLSGIQGYPYFAVGDSIVWLGTLRDNVTIRYSLRVTGLDEDGLRVAGTADLWLAD
jgi:hypothetical protein